MQSLTMTTSEPDGIRNYSFECHDPARAAEIVSTTVRNLDAHGGVLLSVETS